MLDRADCGNDTETSLGGGSSVSRRSVVKTIVALGGGLLLGVSVNDMGDVAAAESTSEFAPNAYVRIGRDGRVNLIVPQVEMGQGTYTSLPMLIAEELEVRLDQVSIEPAPANDRLYSNPLLGLQVTGGSTSIRGFWEPVSKAGATARAMLLEAAAATWQVHADSCRAKGGEIIHLPTGRRLSYAELADKAAELPVPENVPLKKPEEYRLIGTSAKRLDGPDKVNGRAIFGIDVQIPGMKIATVAACPILGGKLVQVNDTRARNIKHVRQVVRLENAITWARQGRGSPLSTSSGTPDRTLSSRAPTLSGNLRTHRNRRAWSQEEGAISARPWLVQPGGSRPCMKCLCSPMPPWSR